MKKLATLGTLALLSVVLMGVAQAKKSPVHSHKSAGQHTLHCSVLRNAKTGPCKAFYIFPRSTRTIEISDIQPGKKYQCYFSGYHTWGKKGKRSGEVLRKSGLVGLSIPKLKFERGRHITGKVSNHFPLQNPIRIDASDSERGGSAMFVLKNHASTNGNYVTISCHEVVTFSN